MSALKIGVLGAARITPKAVIDPARVLSTVEVAACAARDRMKAEAFVTRHAIPVVHSTYDALVSDPGIDLVYNPLPGNLHAEWSIKALEAGKHVLCEKPFAMNSDEAAAVLEAAKANKKRVVEAFHYRFHPAFKTLLEWVTSGAIGKVNAIDAAFNVQIKDTGYEIRHQVETGGGAMMDLGCYPLSAILEILDETPAGIEAEANLTPAGVDEKLSATLNFSSGVHATLSTNMAMNQPFETFIRITGDKGRIEFDNFVHPHRGGALKLETSNGPQMQADISPISTYTWQLSALARALQFGETFLMEGDVVLRQQAVLDAIYEAADLGHLRWR